MIQEIITTYLPLLLPTVVSLFLGYIFVKFKFSEGLREATRDLMTGVGDTWEVYVKETKRASSDGKLTEKEKIIARGMAWEKALQVATTKGKKFLMALGKEKGSAMITNIVNKVSKK